MVKAWRFVTIMLVALSMGMAFCHLLEMPVRLGYDPALWSRVTNVEGTYRLFGSVGAVLEVGGVIAALVLAYMVRDRRAAFRPSAAAALLMLAAHLVWWLLVFPANNEMAGWTPDSLPSDFEAWRNQWEYTHGARAILQIAALAALVLSVLIETPRESPNEPERAGPMAET